MELLLDKLKMMKTNKDFLNQMNSWRKLPSGDPRLRGPFFVSARLNLWIRSARLRQREAQRAARLAKLELCQFCASLLFFEIHLEVRREGWHSSGLR